MSGGELNVVTGAFSYSGKYITRGLLALGKRIRTLTGHPERTNPFGDRVEVRPFNFDNPAAMVTNLRGATTIYNTYWVRFSHGRVTFADAVANTKKLIAAAREAGVARIVHVSISNPSLDSPLPYFSGKAELEEAVKTSGLAYAIVRPTVIFGDEDILINNIAWLLRRSPVFAVPGNGQYQLQPIYVEDFAQLVIDAGQRSDNFTMDAVGPEIFTYEELVRLIARKIGVHSHIMHLSPSLVLLAARIVGTFVGDVVLTPDEVKGLTANLLVSKDLPTGHTLLSDWLEQHSATVGAKYSSELKRHYDRRAQV